MFILKKLLTSLILPPNSLLFVALASLWLSRHKPRLGKALCAGSLLLLLLLNISWTGIQLQQTLEIYPVINATALKQAQVIVVLGGGSYTGAPEYGNDTISGSSLERTRYAAWLHKKTSLPILVTGGAPFGGTPEGKSMQLTLTNEFQVPVAYVESTSRDTYENAVKSAAILRQEGLTHIALVSSAWHLRRAVPLFEQQGLTVLPAPTVFTSNTETTYADLLPGSGEKARQALHEWLGILASSAHKN